jgi:hypothetical protein
VSLSASTIAADGNGSRFNAPRHSEHAFAPDRRDLDHAAVFENRHDRGEPAARKVDLINRLTGFVKNALSLRALAPNVAVSLA